MLAQNQRACFLMGWCRTNKRIVAWLALVALAFQFLCTFGHIHLGTFGPAVQTSVQTTDAAAGTPPPQKDPGPAADFCAVCAHISLAAALILPILAFILAPGLFTQVLRWPSTPDEPAAFGHQPSGARGPPYA
jgi:hypothetical protein